MTKLTDNSNIDPPQVLLCYLIVIAGGGDEQILEVYAKRCQDLSRITQGMKVIPADLLKQGGINIGEPQ